MARYFDVPIATGETTFNDLSANGYFSSRISNYSASDAYTSLFACSSNNGKCVRLSVNAARELFNVPTNVINFYCFAVFSTVSSDIVYSKSPPGTASTSYSSSLQNSTVIYNNRRYLIAANAVWQTSGAQETGATGLYDTISESEAYDSIAELLSDYNIPSIATGTRPITYRLTNCSAPDAPISAAVGDTVNVPLVLQEGYDIITPSTDILVTNNGVTVSHTYSNGIISFTMPDPD